MPNIPQPIPFQPKRTRIDIFSAVLRAKKEFGGSKVAIVDGDERELTYTEIVRASFALGSAIKGLSSKNVAIDIPANFRKCLMTPFESNTSFLWWSAREARNGQRM